MHASSPIPLADPITINRTVGSSQKLVVTFVGVVLTDVEGIVVLNKMEGFVVLNKMEGFVVLNKMEGFVVLNKMEGFVKSGLVTKHSSSAMIMKCVRLVHKLNLNQSKVLVLHTLALLS